MATRVEEPPEVLLLGAPQLRQTSKEVVLASDAEIPGEAAQLHARLRHFRQEFGFGRAIAAPQIGVRKRFIALNLDGRAWTLINPQITWRSDERFQLWDDCMSFPDLMVRVSRHASVSVAFTDLEGHRHSWAKLDRMTAELLQHEIDHLDGILALDRATTPAAIVDRTQFQQRRDYYLAQLSATP